MARNANGHPVGCVKPHPREFAERFYVMGVQIATTLAAFLTSMFVSGKHPLAPHLHFEGSANTRVDRSYPLWLPPIPGEAQFSGFLPALLVS